MAPDVGGKRTAVVSLAVVLILATGMVVGGMRGAQMGYENATTCGKVYIYDYGTVEDPEATPGDVVEFANLTAEERRAFRSALRNETDVAWPNEDPVPIVHYNGTHYGLRGVTADCTFIDQILLYGGILSFLLGAGAWILTIRYARQGWRAVD